MGNSCIRVHKDVKKATSRILIFEWIILLIQVVFQLYYLRHSSAAAVLSMLMLRAPEQHATHAVTILFGRDGHRMGTVCAFVCKPLFSLWPKAGGGRGCSCPYLSCPTIVQAVSQQRIEIHEPLNHPSCSLDVHTHSFSHTSSRPPYGWVFIYAKAWPFLEEIAMLWTYIVTMV